MEKLSDLVAGAKRKDQHAITQLYIASRDKALYIARDMLKDEDEAQDVVQDAFIKAFDNLDSLERPEKFQGWLDTIVINRCRDLLRRKRPMLFTQLASNDGIDPTLQWEDTNEEFQPEANLDYSETRRLIKEMIDSLPDPQRIATTLFYLEDMSVREIAAFMGCSDNTVKSRLNLARKNIKAQVLALEKKGTKLYCVPLIPFLYWMYRQEFAAYAAAGAAGTAGAAVGAASAGISSGAAGTSAGAAGISGGAAGTSAGAAGTSAGAAGAAAAAKGAGAGIAVKAAIAAAAAVVLTVAAGSAVVVTHIINKTETAGAGWAAEEPGMSRETAVAAAVSWPEAAGVELAGEELTALQALYGLKDTDDPDAFTECIIQNRQVLYNLYQDKLRGGPYLFTGREFELTDTGTGVYLKDPNTVYSGDLAGGLPDGQGNLGRWSWGYHTISNENYLSKGKAFSVLVADSYLGGWSAGKADGAGVNGQHEYKEYSGFDMDIFQQALEAGFEASYYTDMTTSTVFKDGLVNGPVEKHYEGNIYHFNMQDGKIVLDEHVLEETDRGRSRYYVPAPDGKHRYTVKLDSTFKNTCAWDINLSHQLCPDYTPPGGPIQDWAYIELLGDILKNIPFKDYPRFTMDILDYAVSQGYVRAEDLADENSGSVISCDGAPLITDEYIQFHFTVKSMQVDEDAEFDFRYYIADGSSDYTRSGAAD